MHLFKSLFFFFSRAYYGQSQVQPLQYNIRCLGIESELSACHLMDREVSCTKQQGAGVACSSMCDITIIIGHADLLNK